jgi:hypothetical protein
MANEIETTETQHALTSLSVLHEHSKTIITLATSFLGLTVAFAGTILGQNPPLSQIILLTIVWFLLIGVVLTAIVCVVQIYRYLLSGEQGTTQDGSSKKPKNWRHRAASVGALSYLILLMAGLVFGVLGVVRLRTRNSQPDVVSASKQAIEFLSASAHVDGSKVSIERVVSDDPRQTYHMVAVDDRQKRYEITIDWGNKIITGYEQLTGRELSAPKEPPAPPTAQMDPPVRHPSKRCSGNNKRRASPHLNKKP